MAWAWLLELSVGAILLMAAVSKAARMPAFVAALRTYRLVPDSKATALARVTVLCEAAVGVLLVSPWLAPWALTAACGLFTIFALTGWIESREGAGAGSRADCGCLGGVVRLRIGRMTIALNAIIAAACAASAAAFALTSEATVDARLDELAAGVALPAALSIAALYWLTTYAVSVVALMNDAVRPEER